MNGFEKHNIISSSASQVNLFANCPSLWIAEKLFGWKGRMGAAAKRGIAIERAVVDVLARGKSEEQAIADAEVWFAPQRTLNFGETRDDAERAMIAPCVALAVSELKQYGEPEFKDAGQQDKVELVCNGDSWRLPLIGYTDLPYPKHGITIDLKTTMRMPSEMPVNHKRQAAIYSRAGNHQIRFLYVSAKKAVWHECEDNIKYLADVKDILNRKERFLRLGDKELLRDVVHLDRDSFYWTGNEAIMKEVYSK